MWKVLIEHGALKYLESLGQRRMENIKESLRLLKESPYPGQGIGDKKEIKGTSKSAFRMRVGDYRAFYIIEENSKTVKVTEIMTAEAAHKKYVQV
ncbi:MAG: type II toxin-antitoxin system RelE/ParE family toxin [Candidatus Aenigmarchaeota archaeon]|nr:type II toxin-antitoxin system RelE/ParE family toxin [Candidatus Aenigmarchaeota archaeon]